MTDHGNTSGGYCDETSLDGLCCSLEEGHDGPHGSMADGEITWWSK